MRTKVTITVTLQEGYTPEQLGEVQEQALKLGGLPGVRAVESVLSEHVLKIPAPGTCLGPCRQLCTHGDCNLSRDQARSLCAHCGKPIGYETGFYYVSNAPDKFAHATCEEAWASALSAPSHTCPSNGDYDPSCAACRQLADEAADNRVIDQGY